MNTKTPSPSFPVAAIYLLAGLVSVPLAAQTDLSQPSPTTPNESTHSLFPRSDLPKDSMIKNADRSFLEKAAKSGMEEIAISKGAADRLNNPQVKAFAAMMISDHSAANAELMTLAGTKGVTLPPSDREVMKLQETWSKKNKGVDEDYVSKMLDDHEEAVKMFEKASKSDNADVASFAQKTLPTLQHHLAMAKDLKKMVK